MLVPVPVPLPVTLLTSLLGHVHGCVEQAVDAILAGGDIADALEQSVPYLDDHEVKYTV